MWLKGRFAYICVAVLIVSVWNSGYPGSQDLANSVKVAIEETEAADWPDQCRSFRQIVLDNEQASEPQRIAPLAVDTETPRFRTTGWNGIRIPIPDAKFDEVVMIPGSIASVRSDTDNLIVSRLDLEPHFGHFEEVEGFSDYVESRRQLVDWIDRGLELRDEDIYCSPESMIEDIVRIVHSLIAGMLVLVNEDTKLVQLSGTSPALILGSASGPNNTPRIKYIFQHPASNNAEMIELTYHFKQPIELIQQMSVFASSIDSGQSLPERGLSEVVRAILDNNYSEASSVAESSGLTVRVGLH